MQVDAVTAGQIEYPSEGIFLVWEENVPVVLESFHVCSIGRTLDFSPAFFYSKKWERKTIHIFLLCYIFSIFTNDTFSRIRLYLVFDGLHIL